jgi:pimeloyl-ACP methyl ester carboxylesterase
VDHRADIYAVGVVAYELLTGDPPFRGTSQQILSAHTTRTAPPLQFLRPDVPRPLADIIMRCLQKRPEDRWQHAGDLLLRLEALDGDLASWTVHGPAPPEDRDVALTERTFRLTDGVCRKLDRGALDSRMIGDTMTCLDNNVESDVLVCYLHGTGLDQRHFQTILSQSPYRSIAPTFYGCEPAARRRVSLPLAAHATLVYELIQEAVDRLRPGMTVVVGFSSGGDFAMRMLSTAADRRIVDGVVTLDCNLSFETCFLTRVLAEMRLDEPEQLLAQLRGVGERIGSVGEWVDVHEYLVKILHKFRGDLGPLQRYAGDLIAPFTRPGPSPFIQWFSAVSAVVPVVRCVFSDSTANNAALDRIRLENLDGAVLGPEYQPDCLVTESGTEHFDLIGVDLVRRNVDAAVDRLRQRVS